MRLPTPRGPISDDLLRALADRPSARSLRFVEPDDDEDEQLALWTMQQLSYRRIDGVDPAWEEDPSFLTLRAALERRLEAGLRDVLPAVTCAPADAAEALTELVARADGPSLSQWMDRHGTVDHMREFVVHRAAYQLQEADPHSFAIPRLAPSLAKTALLQLQVDEYGGQEPTEAHALLFTTTMDELGLPVVADLDRLPATTLATTTVMNLFGRSRRLVPALLGHLAVFEMTSVASMARYASVLRRLLPEPAATRAARFYDVHVAADGLHGTIATDRLISGFAGDHPDEVGDVLFGAAAVLHVERRFAEHLLESWGAGESSLRTPLPGAHPNLRPAFAIAS